MPSIHTFIHRSITRPCISHKSRRVLCQIESTASQLSMGSALLRKFGPNPGFEVKNIDAPNFGNFFDGRGLTLRIMAGGDLAAPLPSAPALVREPRHGRLGKYRSHEYRNRE